MNIWILFQVCDDGPETMGVYDSRQAAEVAATRKNHCVCGPLTLNETMPIERINWSDCFFPLAPNFRSPEIFRDGVQMFPPEGGAR